MSKEGVLGILEHRGMREVWNRVRKSSGRLERMRKRILRKVLSIGLVFILIAVVFAGIPVNVSADSQDSVTIIVPDDYSTVQAAINAANAGDTVFVRVGTYYESVIIDKSIILQGENRDTTIIYRKFTDWISPYTIYVYADDVQIKGLSVRTVWYSRWHGIGLIGSSNCVIENNYIFETSIPIYLSYADNNIIRDNICKFNDFYGINIEYSKNNIIENNMCISNLHYNIILLYSSNNIVRYNTCSNSRFGIMLNGASDNLFIGNTISNNVAHPGYGGGVGIAFSFGLCSNNLFYYNNIIDNLNQLSSNVHPNIWDDSAGKGNYWSDYTGLDNGAGGRVANDGVGDTNLPHQGVDWYPLMVPWSLNNPPVADFTYLPEDPTINQEITFDGSSSSDEDGSIEAWYWDFGDGTNSGWVNGPLITHFYSTTGEYNVGLKVKDNDGLINDILIKKINIIYIWTSNDITIKEITNYEHENWLDYYFNLMESAIDFEYIHSEVRVTIKEYQNIENLKIKTITKAQIPTIRYIDLDFESGLDNLGIYSKKDIIYSGLNNNLLEAASHKILRAALGMYVETQPDVFITEVIIEDIYGNNFNIQIEEKKFVTTRDAANFFQPPGSFSYEIICLSPINLEVYDLHNNLLNYEDNVFYSGPNFEPEFLIIAYPTEENYKIIITGTGDGKYTFISWSIKGGDVIEKKEWKNIPIANGEIQIRYIHVSIPLAVVDNLKEIIKSLEEMDFLKSSEKEIDKTIKYLKKAIDEFDKNKTEKAIGKIEKAVKHLMKAQDKGADTQDVIDELIDLVQDIVDKALADAIGMVGENNKHIQKAQKHYDKALDDLEDEKYDKATKEFKKVYKEAMKARGEWVPDPFIDMLEEAIDEVSDLQTEDLSTKALGHLAKAEAELDKALIEADKDEIDKALDKLKKAIKELKKAMEEDEDADTTLIIDSLLENIEDTVYQKIIDAESVAGTDNKDIKMAWKNFNKALTKSEAGDYDKAVGLFKDAVKSGKKAIS